MNLKELLGDAYKEGMSIDEINTALSGVDLGNQNELNRLRNAVTKANGEAAKYRRETEELKGMTAQTENDWQNKYAELEKRFNASERERKIGTHTASLLELGYDAKLAGETAAAMVDGDVMKILANQKAFIEAHDKKALEEQTRSTPRPAAGGGAGMSVDWNKQYQEAVDNGDMVRAAYLVRTQQENNS